MFWPLQLSTLCVISTSCHSPGMVPSQHIVCSVPFFFMTSCKGDVGSPSGSRRRNAGDTNVLSKSAYVFSWWCLPHADYPAVCKRCWGRVHCLTTTLPSSRLWCWSTFDLFLINFLYITKLASTEIPSSSTPLDYHLKNPADLPLASMTQRLAPLSHWQPSVNYLQVSS